MRAPEDAGLGNAKVTLSFAAWKDGKVASTTLEVPVVAPQPKVEARAASAGGAANRKASTNNLKQIGLALHAYRDTYGTLPAPAIYSKVGRPLLSWRVAILPYLEQEELYKQFKLDEPWDSPHNKKLLDMMPAVFAAPGKPAGHMTHYRVFTGPRTAFEGQKGVGIASFTDGLANTILAVEAKEGAPWTKPDDLPYDPKKPLPALGGLREGGFHILMADGSVRFVSNRFNEQVLRAIITRNGGEAVDPDNLDKK